MANQPVEATAYPPVKIWNSTQHHAFGRVRYLSWSCSDDDYKVDSGQTWTGPYRGICLVTEITAWVKVGGKDVPATPYQSTGTSYSEFVIVWLGGENFAVTRRTAGSEDQRPEGYVEPTTKQK